jgi:hypothetical protein
MDEKVFHRHDEDPATAGRPSRDSHMPTNDTREESAMNTPPIVSPEEWEAARQQLLVKRRS